MSNEQWFRCVKHNTVEADRANREWAERGATPWSGADG